MSEPSDADELVLCVSAEAVRKLFDARVGPGKEFIPGHRLDFDDWIRRAPKAFLPRSMAETDPAWRHFATYQILTDRDRVFGYRRGASGSEGRLHGRLSIGVGGHVTLDDYAGGCGWRDAIDRGLERELHEELAIAASGGVDEIAGLIASDETPVDCVHLGVVYHWDVPASSVTPREDCLADARWMSVGELRERRDELESWSRVVLEHVLVGVKSTRTTAAGA